MAAGTNDTSTISQNQSGFPSYLNFDSLRTNAINYLGPITSKYWTDYNIHDPGITTLEVLLYALMDLGYRANLPIGSLLANDSAAGTPDSNFYTSAQVLGCNPLSINDYRRLLMDIAEVRNAWLEVDDSTFNGLYRVYLELEKDAVDFATTAQWEAYRDKVQRRANGVFQAHRNLCEDLSGIRILKKRRLGVSADIEVIPGTSVADAYQALVTTLYTFFSPVPPYYTLDQLTAMNISLDSVFEGRPYTGLPSHGFILDADLPDRPAGRQPLYLSAVYQAMLGVSGIKTVRRLQLVDGSTGRLLKGEAAGEWTFLLPEDSVPAYSLSGSSFRWYQNGQLLSTDMSVYNNILQMNAAHSGKVLHPAGPPSLDAAIPNQTPLVGLGDYYSIQNDFPQVYGIGPGGLPPTASAARQAQALQFKGYLLFFDQLLADYLAQLSNLRNVFSMSAPGAATTYFGGNLDSVPGLDSLLRFPPADATGGITLMTPYSTTDWEKIVQSAGTSPLPAAAIGALSPYVFSSSVERDTAIATLTVLFTSLPPAVQTVQQDDGQWLYYLSGGDWVLVSYNRFARQDDATGEAVTVLYVGQNADNYALVSLAEVSRYSFHLVGTTQAYYNYLQTILEDPAQYTQRRTDLLNHLLARFNESFTDYALLSAGFLSAGQIADNQVGLMQRFLGDLPALGANRGKAYDYLADGWKSANTSGFEQRIKAYCGIPDRRRHYLCNFEVHKYADTYLVKLTLAGEDVLLSPSSLEEKETMPAVASLYSHLASKESYRVVYREEERRYRFEVRFYQRLVARSVKSWEDEDTARRAAEGLLRMRRLTPEDSDSVISEYIYRPQLLDREGRQVRVSLEGFPSEADAHSAGTKNVKTINATGFWNFDAERVLGKLHPDRRPGRGDQYIDAKGFRIYIQQDILNKPDRCSFELLDEQNSFQFRSTLDFATETQAKSACYQLLHVLTDARNYAVRKEPFGNRYRLIIRDEKEELAETEAIWGSETGARERAYALADEIGRRWYRLHVDSKPYRWKFVFFLGMPGGDSLVFASLDAYESKEASLRAAHAFHRVGADWDWREEEGRIVLRGEAIECELVDSSAPDAAGSLPQLLEVKRDLYRMAAGEEQRLREGIVLDEPSKKGKYVYQLVDKDHPRGFHPVGSATHTEAEDIRDQLIVRGRKGYNFLEICLGGDNIRQQPPSAMTNAGGEPGKYYFQLRCRNDYFVRLGVPMGEDGPVLFESFEGYGSDSDAQAAFGKYYLDILKKAEETHNYGDGRYIGLKDRDMQDGDEVKPFVIVPAATRDALGYAGLEVAATLSRAAITYPIRAIVRKGRDGDTRYRFIVAEGGRIDWSSAEDFASPADAHAAFDFFRMLLCVPANYFIHYDWQACHYRVGIREVLAESAGVFPNEESAWGPKGVERFICTTQTEGAWHFDLRKDCTYSYFIACRNRKAIHPCDYDNSIRRDAAMDRLFRNAAGFPANGWIDAPGFTGTGVGPLDEFEIRDGEGSAIARIPLPASDTAEAILNRILDLQEALWTGQHDWEDHGSLHVSAIADDGSSGFSVRPVGTHTREEWLRRLLKFAAYFPVTRESRLRDGRVTAVYRVSIKLPDFVDLPGDLPAGKDCGCPPASAYGGSTCYVAWENERDFKTAMDAWKAGEDLLPLLAVRENYRPVFTLDGRYGIELIGTADILARNPQLYPYPAMAIAAADLARQRIDSEGLDVVEHLLLREGWLRASSEHPGDTIPVCPSPPGCESVWAEQPTTDADGNPVFPFYPGQDPYSFLVTVVLPAWPRRFRTSENRVMLESILQREAPAHILLRILWLTPRDFCRFETDYEGWIDSLSRMAREERPCGHFEPARLIDLLFRHSLGCLGDCRECGDMPSEDSRDVAQDIGRPDKEWLKQVDRLYCWKESECAGAEDAGKPGEVALLEEVVIGEVTGIREDTGIREEATVTGEPPTAVVERKPRPEDRKVRRLITARLNRYQQKIVDWREGSGKEELAGRASAFLKDPTPSMRRFESLMKELPEIPVLAELLIAFYLDRLVMERAEKAKWDHLLATIRRSGIRIGDPSGFYREWRAEELDPLLDDHDKEKIRSLLRDAQI